MSGGVTIASENGPNFGNGGAVSVQQSYPVSNGWAVDLGPMGTPEGPACIVRDPSGVALALLQVDRPDVMDGAYADPANTHAVR